MWSDSSIFYQFYPLGFCEFLLPEYEKLQSGFPILNASMWMPFIFRPSLSRTGMAMIQEIIERLIVVWGVMRIFLKFVRFSRKMRSVLFWTESLTMWDEASLPFRMCWKSVGTRNTRTGFTFILMEIPATMTASPMRAGKGTLSL